MNYFQCRQEALFLQCVPVSHAYLPHQSAAATVQLADLHTGACQPCLFCCISLATRSKPCTSLQSYAVLISSDSEDENGVVASAKRWWKADKSKDRY